MKDMYTLSDYLKDNINKDFVAGYMSATAYDRVQAFAAIRRAAAVARAAEDYCEGHYDPELDRMFSWVYNHDRDPIAIARGIRMAIRAAIGSEKE